MKRAAVFAFALLLMPWILSAQNPPHSQAQTNFILVLPGPNPSCPAIMHAGHEPGLHAQRYVRDGSKPEAPALHLMLKLMGGRAQITRAAVIVHGVNGNSHMVQTDTLHAGSPDVTRALDLSFTHDEDNTVSTHLVLPGFTSVSSIDVVSATYADGSMWKPVEGHACQVAPDPFMLVAAQTR